MAHVFENQPDARQSSEKIEVSRFRPKYRALSDDEKKLHDDLKTTAQVMELLYESLPNSREKSIAVTKLEESVMWIVKALTA